MRTKLPELPSNFAQQQPKVWKAFETLSDHCHNAGPLDDRTRRLVKLGIAVGAGLEGAVHSQVRNALAEGITPEELRHVVLLSITTLGFPASMAALTWMNDFMAPVHRRQRKGK